MKLVAALMVWGGLSWLGAVSPAIAQTPVEIQASAPEREAATDPHRRADPGHARGHPTPGS